MMPNYYENREKDIRKRWFPNHVAKFTSAEIGKAALTWRHPNNINYYCRYLIEGQFLIVVGDIGEAAYGWSDLITWEFLAGLNLDYFAGKCSASEFGRGYKEWDNDVARYKRKESIYELTVKENISKADLQELAILELLEEHDRHAYHKAGAEYYDESGDAEGASAISRMGEVIALRCQAHLVGIQMAWEQANKK